MLHLLETSKFTPVLSSAQRLLDMIGNGKLFSEDPADKAEAVIVADNLQTNVAAALQVLEDIGYEDSPFLRHREVILDHYSTAERLADLTLHLWNYHNPIELGRLLMNADTRHTRIALELIASYATHGENDPHFMNLANEIRDLKSVAALAA
jgi:hypothetical protein